MSKERERQRKREIRSRFLKCDLQDARHETHFRIFGVIQRSLDFKEKFFSPRLFTIRPRARYDAYICIAHTRYRRSLLDSAHGVFHIY